MKSVLNHIALLVPSVAKSAEYLKQFNFKIGPAEQWEGEGTLEIYVGDLKKEMANLLLMEPVKDGAYSHAMSKRGPGLHHIAIDVLNIEDYIDQLAGSGWLLHPKSLHSIKHSKTAYLARPEMPTLIEVQQQEILSDHHPMFISKLEIPNLSTKNIEMFDRLGLAQIQNSSTDNMILTILEQRILLKNLCL